MIAIRIAALLALCAAWAPAQAQLFKCVGTDGNVTYQSEPCPQTAKEDRLRAPAPGTATEAKPQAAPPKDAADASVYDTAAKRCLDDILAGARKAWQAKVDFPEQDFRSSGAELCNCLAERARANVPAAELRAGTNAIMSKYMQEAIKGGECKPAGVVGLLLQDVR
jgi:hypothetical protein